MSDHIVLHPKHGLAPHLTVCPNCGKDGNEIMLMGIKEFKQICPFHNTHGFCDKRGNCGRRTRGRGKVYCREVVCPFRNQFKGEFE
jgi:hypothetical protein